MPFIHEDFLLQNPTARHLYHKFCRGQPILDFHLASLCGGHRRQSAVSRPFRDLARGRSLQMARHARQRHRRNLLLPAKLRPTTSSLLGLHGPPCLRNPLYHWTHLELQRYFDVDELLDEESAPEIWQHANKLLETPELTAQGILAKFGVRALCTTNDPTDDLQPHAQIAAAQLPTRVYPTFRPDRALDVHLPPSSISGSSVSLPPPTSISVPSRASWTPCANRHDFFHPSWLPSFRPRPGHCLANFCSGIGARAPILREGALRASRNAEEQAEFGLSPDALFRHLDAQSGWTKQFASRRSPRHVNSRALHPSAPIPAMTPSATFPPGGVSVLT